MADQTPDFTQHRLRYVMTREVAAGGRTFVVRLTVTTTEHYWPAYNVQDETDDAHIGPKQRAVVGPVRSALWRELFAAMRAAGWTVDARDATFEPPITHTAQALATMYKGGW